ncbi:R3H domain-containing protein 1-like isoform X3 [Homarus americanus]|nr:R3H domain-containing protein 1-like isoform X3 [Homarus americanus]XP_042210604.1 R3H domain-containing protein 1-like isoform X3 [Homarus americanus]XP_042210605.1 R3H domain-containing protein 1-like isoform X3 [Homarus americanus]
MERAVRPLRPHNTLSKQVSLLDDDCDEGVDDGGDLLPDTPPTHPHSHTPPPTPPGGRGVSPPSPSANFTHHQSGPPHGPGPGGGGGGLNNQVGHGGLGHGGSNHTGPNHGSQGHTAQGQGRSKSLELHQQRSTDSDKEAPLVTSARHRHHGGKPKLLQRSHAMREDTSPPPELLEPVPPSSHCSNNSSGGNTLTVSTGGGSRRRLKHQGSSQGSFDGSSPCLSRDSSMEYTDSSGVDLQQFIIQTLHKNQKDRMMLLKIEHELVSLVKDTKRTHHKFPPMSSYQRMLVHRCAAFFGLEHNVDQAGTAVIVNKTRNTRLPETRFRDHCRDDLLVPDEPKRSILKRDSSSFDDGSNYKSLDRQFSSESRRSKSFEEREEEYEKVRKRIFSQESLSSADGLGDSPVRSHDSRRNSQDDSRWHEHRNWSFMDSEVSHRKHHYDNHRLRPGRLPKVESFESRDTLHPRSLRPPVFKSHSFGGYSGGVTVLSRGESVSSNISSSRLSKQDSTSSRISDQSMSSGYKSQRQDTSSTNVSNTLSTTPSPTTSQHQQSSNSQVGMWGGEGDSQAVMWAVTDMEAVPPGAMLINPQSGQPYMNSDGSVYRFDPNNPPQLSPSVNGSSSGGGNSRDKDSSSEKNTTTSQPSGGSNGSITTCITQIPAVSPSSPHDITPPASNSVRSPPSKQHSLQQSSPEPAQNVVSGGVSNNGEVRETEGSTGTGNGGTNEGVVQQAPQVIYPQYYQIESRSYSQEGHANEVTNQMRGLCLSGPSSGGDSGSDLTAVPAPAAPVPQSYVVPRQHYTQPVYYMPSGNVGNMSGSLKYVYPQYQMAPVQATPAGVQAPTGVQAAGMQQVQGMPAVPAVPAVAGAVPAAPVPPTAHHPSMDHNPALPQGGGYLPGGYTVVTYPAGGSVGGTSNGQETGGTTYYYQLPVTAAGAGLTGPIPTGQPATSLQQYTLTPSTSTTTFPQWCQREHWHLFSCLPSELIQHQNVPQPERMGSSMGYYTASGMPGGGVYQTMGGMQGMSGGMYGTPQGPTAAGHTTTVSYRAPTPPQTPSTQGMSMSLGYVSGSSGGVGVAPAGGVGGQYMAMVPPQQPPTPTSHAPPQLFTTFFRPSVQMMSGSAGTPPPQPVLQYGGGAAPPTGPPGTVTPHPPVFAKPYMGPTMHTIMPGHLPDQSGIGKDDKRLITMTQNMGGAPGGPTTQLLARPYSIMQSDMRIFGGTSGLPNTGGMSGGSLPGGGAPGHMRAAPLLLAGARPRHPNAFTPTPLAPLSLARPPKVRRQRSRTSYVRSTEVMTPQLSVEGQESND